MPAEPATADPAPTAAAAGAPMGPRRERGQAAWLAVRGEIPPWLYRTLVALGFISLLSLWAWASHQPWVNPVFVPSPSRVWQTAWEFLHDGYLWPDVQISLYRVTAGFLLSAALAIPVGVFMGSFRVCEGLLQPLTEYVRYIPVPALIPLLMLFFGIGEMAKVMLIFVGTF
ncbi:MAG: ABC transporter permease, partial [Verrucomicrobiota bacterium]